MSILVALRESLEKSARVSEEKQTMFFKTGVGDYAAHDKFLGINVPTLRTLAKNFQDLPLDDLQDLIASRFNEERLLALFILISQYQKADTKNQNKLYDFYLSNIKHVNNWNLVDASAHLIVGCHLFKKDRTLLGILAQSTNLWERRIAIIATWYFIRQDDFEWTLKLAKLFLNDSHDLMHKAVGWMLREVGKRNQAVLMPFLEQHAASMPRTMLSYAIEKFSDEQRKTYRNKK